MVSTLLIRILFCYEAERIIMNTHHRIRQITIQISIVAFIMLAAALLFPAVKFAASEPDTQPPSAQKEKHNRLIHDPG
jgi:hypothetical protein